MDYTEQQKREIATVAPRMMNINLSDSDVKRLYVKAAGASLTPEELIEKFIGDLVCGTYSNGSDERMYADQWFDRCDFSGYGTFLAYLVNDVIYDYFTDLQNTVTKCGKELEKLDISDFDSSDGYEEEKNYLQKCLQDAEDEIQEMFDDYCSCNKNHKTYEQEAEGVFKFRENLKKALAHKKERFLMNCKNFQYAQKARKGGCGEKPDCSMDSIYAEGVSCDYLEQEDYEKQEVRDSEEFRDFLKMAEAIAEQEYRYKKFLAVVIFAVFAILTFSGFFIFAKNRKVCKCEKTENSKI